MDKCYSMPLYISSQLFLLLYKSRFYFDTPLDPIEPDDYDTAVRRNVTYHMTCFF